jgi:hypothetical protein
VRSQLGEEIVTDSEKAVDPRPKAVRTESKVEPLPPGLNREGAGSKRLARSRQTSDLGAASHYKAANYE